MSSHMYPENPEGTQVIVGSMNMGYISDTARNRTHNLFRPKREPIPLGHSDGQSNNLLEQVQLLCYLFTYCHIHTHIPSLPIHGFLTITLDNVTKFT